MGFPINFSHYGKTQQNLLYGESMRNWYSYSSYSMGAFFPLDSHPIVYFIICEIMYGILHQFPMVQGNATKPIVQGEPGKLVLIHFP